MMLVRTGFKAALAAEMVSFWIWRSDALFERFSPEGFPRAVGGPAGADDGAEAEEIEEEDEDEAAGAEEGSAVIRSMRVVPEESCSPPNWTWIKIQ